MAMTAVYAKVYVELFLKQHFCLDLTLLFLSLNKEEICLKQIANKLDLSSFFFANFGGYIDFQNFTLRSFLVLENGHLVEFFCVWIALNSRQ
jgi:hypothetical protein